MNIWRRWGNRCRIWATLLSLFLLSGATPAAVPPTPKASAEKPLVQLIRTPILNLNPFLLTGIEPFSITNYVIENLAILDPQTKRLKPYLAQSWSVAKDGRSFRVQLRPEALFHNGDPVLAEDVRFTWSAFMDPTFQAGIWKPMWENVQSVQVFSSRELDVRLRQADYQTFVNFMTTLRILPRSFYAKGNQRKWRGQMVGSGPFQIRRFDSGRSLDLIPFTKWWGWKFFGVQPPAGLRVKTIADPNLIQAMLQKGEADFFEARNSLLSQTGPRFMTNPMKVQWIESAIGEGFGIELNLKDEKFSHPKVREALLLLWNRQHLVEKVYGPQYSIALDCFSPRLPTYPKGQPSPYDLNKARRLLRESGWQDRDQDSVLENQDGQKFEFKILVTSAHSERWLTFYQQDARQAGVKVKIYRLPEDAQYWQKLRDGKFEAIAYEGGLADAVHSTTWKTNAPYNYTHFSSAKVDTALNKLEAEFNESARLNLQGEMIREVRLSFARLPGLVNLKSQVWTSRRLLLDSKNPTLAWRWRRQD